MDWDKLRIFHEAAEAGSFTHAGEKLDMSQSAVSRQVSALEKELNVPLFNRHARGLMLTEQGEMLYRTAHDVFQKLRATQTRLADSKTKPFGDFRITTTVALGSSWLAPRIGEFIELYPDIRVELMLEYDQLDLTMREADVGIWLRPPSQGDLIQRRLFTVHLHIYASSGYIKRFGPPKDLADLDNHRILTFGGFAPPQIREINWLEEVGREGGEKRAPVLRVNNLYALKRACQRDLGLAILPDYMAREESNLVQVLTDAELPAFETFFVYPEGARESKRVSVFRDFIVAKAREWSF
ncbi:MAG: LysR family transcriptional regulator [Hyphomicrobiaceae bacterium]|nr:LysR family transcriptional regulator [Hyphomicrobiaceae bacterium]